MSDQKKSKESQSVRVGAVLTVVVGLVFLAGAWRLEHQAGKLQDVTSVQALTKQRPVVGEWLFVATADHVAFSRTAGMLFVVGLCFVVMGLGIMDQAKVLTRLEGLEREIARLTKERSGPNGAGLPVEPGKK
jgi:hypothetical protein